ncbi:copper resistance CopC family protein [Nonomuraea jabiensis]|uniref:Methionine-rich copper-binding protein CopC n=1 Tax=Nonomuraea jabiensis TaxID=882448 RepID=A0A7W9LIG9_9ACTN|nr:copper resistance CopC family protein [Nonomuraea jabiensis]MBB5785066.1 methionine-rich copper-binding protein CopC [Nonomuraea jabiensis]
MRRLLTVLLLAFAAAGIAPPAAQAHNVLISSDPKDGATLPAAPARVTLVFDQAVRQGYAQVGVTGPDGSSWADGAAEVAAERVSVRVKPLPSAGAYTVGYRILSADGHPVTGKITFILAAGAATGGPAPNTGQDAGQDPGANTSQNTGQDAGQGATGQAPRDASAQAAEAAANGGAGMAVVWIVGALLLLAAGTAVALRRSRPAATAPAPGATGEARPEATPAGEAQPGAAGEEARA